MIDSYMSSRPGDHHPPALARTLCLVVQESTGVSDGAYYTEAYGGLVEGLLGLSMTVGIQPQGNLAHPVGRDLQSTTPVTTPSPLFFSFH